MFDLFGGNQKNGMEQKVLVEDPLLVAEHHCSNIAIIVHWVEHVFPNIGCCPP